jgi:hypothetical protein
VLDGNVVESPIIEKVKRCERRSRVLFRGEDWRAGEGEGRGQGAC